MQQFPDIQLSFEETRVLGSLLEKQVLTPDAYPLSLNSLVTACNQTSSRFPVTTLSAEDAMKALRGLSEKNLVEKILGGRTAKYEHCLDHVLSVPDAERAILTVLLLRGAQTAGDLKQRTEPLHPFHSLDAVEEALTWFIDYPHGPLVRRIPADDVRRVETFEHLLSERLAPPEAETPAEPPPEDESSWQDRIEAQIAALQREVAALRERLGD